MIRARLFLPVIVTSRAIAPLTIAADDPISERQELMKDVGGAAKPIGEMFRGEREYDAATVLESLNTWKTVGETFGDLFPEGSESGGDSEAAPAIWEDRAGFDEALALWREATDKAIAAAPATLEEGQPVLGAVFNACKNCHDSYRIDDE